MHVRAVRLLCALAVLLALTVTVGVVAAAAPPADVPPAPLRVGVAGSPPFVFHRERPAGLAVEVFEATAQAAQVPYVLVPLGGVAEGFASLERRDVDVLVGDISITASRAERFRFSPPFYRSSLGIATHRTGVTTFSLRSMSRILTLVLGALLVALVVVGAAVWRVERKSNPEQFPPSAARGIGRGIWFALVTLTTVGYGDVVPKTHLGRVISGGWMFIGFVSSSSLAATIATVFAVSARPIVDVDRNHLVHERVAVVAGSTGEDFAKTFSRVKPMKSMEAALQAVAAREADALVFDHTQLVYYLQTHEDAEISVSRFTYRPQLYGFVMRRDAAFAERLDRSLLGRIEDGTLERLQQQWLGAQERAPDR